MNAKEYNDRGYAFCVDGRYDESIKAYTKAIAAESELAATYRYRGEVYMEIGEFDLAMADFRKSIELSENKRASAAPPISLGPLRSPEELCDKGELLGETGDYGGAMAAFNEAIFTNKGYVRAWLDRAFTNYKTGEYDAALADYAYVVALAPRDPRAYGCRGNVYRDKGDIPAALKDYAKALRLSPKYSLAYYDRGSAYVRIGKNAEAAKNFKKYLAMQPSEYDYMVPWANYSLACLEALAGRKAEALELLEKALSAGLRDKAYIDADRDLDSLRDDPAFTRLIAKGFPSA